MNRLCFGTEGSLMTFKATRGSDYFVPVAILPALPRIDHDDVLFKLCVVL